MISKEREAEILRLYHAEGWRVNTIARQLGVHHTTVQRVLAQSGIPSEKLTARPSMAEPYVPFIVETLTKYPRLCASRVFEMVRKRGYPAAPTTSAAWWPGCAPASPPRRSCACTRCRASRPRAPIGLKP